MAERDTRIRLAAGLAISLALHAALVLPLFIEAVTTSAAAVDRRAAFSPERPPEELETPPDITLGIDDGSPSTLTWIGYETYEEHLAEIAEIEQAAFSDSATGAPVNSADVDPLAMPDAQVAADQATGDTPAEVSEPADLAESAAAMNADQQASESPDRVTESSPRLLAFLNDQANRLSQMQAMFDALRDIELPVLQPVQESDSDSRSKDQDRSNADRPHAAETPQRDRSSEDRPPSDEQPSDPGEQGERAEKYSPPTSTVEVLYDKVKAGQPLAAEGLELRPQKPTLTVLQQVKGVPCNPLARIEFTAEGRPAFVELLESSRDTRFDDAIVASLYRWRASGEYLEQIEPDATFDLEIRIVLRPGNCP